MDSYAIGFVMRTSQHLLGQMRRAIAVQSLFGMIMALVAAGVPLALLHLDGWDELAMAGLLGSALLTLVVLQCVRERLVTRAAQWIGHTLGRHVMASGLKRGAPAGDLAADQDAVRGLAAMLSRHAPITKSDVIFAPIFVAALAIIHPGLAVVAGAMTAVVLLVCLAARRVLPDFQTSADVAMFGAVAVQRARLTRALGLADGLASQWALADGRRVGALFRGDTLRARLRLMNGITVGAGIAALGVMAGSLPLGTMALLASALIAIGLVRTLVNATDAFADQSLIRAATERLGALGDVTPGEAVAPSRAAIMISGATVAHAGRIHPALEGASLTIAPGECLAISGPAASGKSTLAAVIAGAAYPQGGAATWRGLPLAAWHAPGLETSIGYAPEDPLLFAGTIGENIARFQPATREAIEFAARSAGVHDILANLADGLDTAVGAGGIALSFAERRAVALARALFGQPALVVLDQPELGLSQPAIQRLAAALAQLRLSGATIVLVTHEPRLLTDAQRVVQMEHGRITAIRSVHRTGHPLPHRVPPQAHAAALLQPMH